MDLPTLYTKRLLIRPISINDAQDLFEYAQTDLVGPHAGWEPHRSIQETIQVLRAMTIYKPNYEPGNWAMVDLQTGKMIGTIELYNYFPSFKAELGYSLNPAYWGNGLTKEAGEAVLYFAFHTLRLKRVEAGTFVDNIQSQRVCEKLGFTKEGILRNGYMRYDGKIFDKLVYGITIEDFLELEKNKLQGK